VNFLNGSESDDDEDDLPNCFHFGRIFARSPRIPVKLEGIRSPMLLDTGAEVTIVSTAFMQYVSGKRATRNRARSPLASGRPHFS